MIIIISNANETAKVALNLIYTCTKKLKNEILFWIAITYCYLVLILFMKNDTNNKYNFLTLTVVSAIFRTNTLFEMRVSFQIDCRRR